MYERELEFALQAAPVARAAAARIDGQPSAVSRRPYSLLRRFLPDAGHLSRLLNLFLPRMRNGIYACGSAVSWGCAERKNNLLEPGGPAPAAHPAARMDRRNSTVRRLKIVAAARSKGDASSDPASFS